MKASTYLIGLNKEVAKIVGDKLRVRNEMIQNVNFLAAIASKFFASRKWREDNDVIGLPNKFSYLNRICSL